MSKHYISQSLNYSGGGPMITIHSMKSDFILVCKCGTITTYGSSFNTEWKDGMSLECRECGSKYYPAIHVDIITEIEEVEIIDLIDVIEDSKPERQE